MKQSAFQGNDLKQRREELGLSVYEVYRNTRIPARFIEAVERADVPALPEECYTVGFLKTYCVFLGLDAEPYVHSYRAYARPPAHRFLSRARNVQAAPPAWMQDLATWAVILVLVGLGWLAYTFVFQPQNDTIESRVQAGTVELVVPPAPTNTNR